MQSAISTTPAEVVPVEHCRGGLVNSRNDGLKWSLVYTFR